MKIIHCSDIHLDSRMETNLSARQARERNAEVCTTFARMVDYAEEQGVAAVLIAGDLFDSRRVSAQTADFVLDRVRRASGIDFLYLRGNHDEARDPFAGQALPENLKTFGEGWTYYEYGDVTIAGLELGKDNWAGMYGSLMLEPERTNIVMLHGQVSTQPGEELIALPQLRGKHIRYLALGHIHSYQKERLDPEGEYCYCGCLEGRGFDECGEKGFVLLEAERGKVRGEFVPFAARNLREVPVDITDLTTVTQLRQAMEKAAEGIDGKDLVKFTLTGTFTLETQKDLQFLKKSLEPLFWFVKIKDESRFRIEKETYEHDASLKGEFIRLVMASDRSEEEKAQIICCGIQALSGEEIIL
ncbi:MAG: DNA repair exonuclease [Oscillospiraceae bacterium]|nr:DNA repair exonuclease [Oscillospiraceae bacterium]